MSKELQENPLHHVLACFQHENVPSQLEQIIATDVEVNNILKEAPNSRQLLNEKAREVYQEYKGLLIAAKLVDSWDRVKSIVELIAEATTGALGVFLSEGGEMLDLIPKALFSAYYYRKTKDVAGVMVFGASELASQVPGLGPLVDIVNLYIYRTRQSYRNTVAERFKDAIYLERKVYGKDTVVVDVEVVQESKPCKPKGYLDKPK